MRAEATTSAGARATLVPDAFTPVLALALRDADPSVVGRAAQGLGALGDVRSVPMLIPALDRMSGEITAFDRVQQALMRLLEEPRAHTSQEWRRIWSQRGAALLERRSGGTPPR
ncbi:MAG: hypothetical protein R3F34_16840 [Planctomycetota bacterium]